MTPDFGKCEQSGGGIFSSDGGIPVSITMSSSTGNVPSNVMGKAEYHCDPGFYLPLMSCPECKGCPAGQYYTSSNASAVETCPGTSASSYQPPPVACIPCPAGKFQDRSAQPSCIDCPAGKYAPTGLPPCFLCLYLCICHPRTRTHHVLYQPLIISRFLALSSERESERYKGESEYP